MPVYHMMDFENAAVQADALKQTMEAARDYIRDLERDRVRLQQRIDALEGAMTSTAEAAPGSTNPLVKTPEPIESARTKPATRAPADIPQEKVQGKSVTKP